MGARSQRLMFVLVLCLLTTTASAQPSRGPEAETLFLDGKRAMSADSYDAACAKFAASHALEPRASTLMNLGACHEAAGRVVSAWYAFFEAAKLANSSADPRESGLAAPSLQRANMLSPRRSSIVVVVADAARIDGFVVARNGEPIAEAQWNSPIYLDGGKYTVVARGTNTETWTADVALASEFDEKRVEIPVLYASVTPAAESAKISGADNAQPGGRSREPFTFGRKIAIGIGVAGITAAVAGVYFGLDASSKQSDSNAICPEATCGDPEGLRLNAAAQSSATKANMLWIIGAAALAGGATLWLLKGPDASSTGSMALGPMFGNGIDGIAAQGSF